MREYQFNSYSVEEATLFEMHQLMKYRKLLENNKNVKDYLEFINQEKLSTTSISSLIEDTCYYPLNLNSVPEGNMLIITYSENPAKFIIEQDNKLFFDINRKNINFPISHKYGDGYLDTLIYSNQTDQKHFLSILGLKFSSWTIKSKKI